MPLLSGVSLLRQDPDLEFVLKRTLDDPRWLKVRHDTPVLWEGKPCLFGQLAGNEKMELEFDADGQLVGGFPF